MENHLFYQFHSTTSRDAARSMAMGAAPLRAKVYRTLLLHERMTDEDIQAVTGLDPSTERPRRIELVRLGLVRDSGHRGTTSSGRSAVQWEVVRQPAVQMELEPRSRH